MISINNERTFIFENANGTRYKVVLDVSSGAGYGQLVGGDNAVTGKANVSLQVDAAKLSGLSAHTDSFYIHMPIFNTGKRLSQILTA